MSQKNSAQNIISSYRKRQQMGPFFIGGLAVVLVIVGILILAVWLTGANRPAIALFSSPTPTATLTFTATPVTPTATATATATVTATVAPTVTFTPAGPTQYTVKEGDICWNIAATNKVDLEVLLAINSFAPGTCPIKVGQKIWIPTVNQKLDTPTPIPSDFRTEFIYNVQTGDSLQTIAAKFFTTVDDIKTRNADKVKDINNIFAGMALKIKPNIVTNTPTRVATSTAGPALGTKASTPTVTATKKP